MMTGLQWWLGVLGEIILAVILVGLFVRGRGGRCYSFTVYVIAVLTSEILITAWPHEFFVLEKWLFKETLLNALKYAIALELAARTFRAFPGARATARAVVFLVVLVSLAAVLQAVPVTRVADFAELASQLHTRILNSTIWVFTALAAVILWYRLPVDLFHKAILVGFVPYLLVFTVVMNLLKAIGWHVLEQVSYLQTGAYLLLLGYWGYAAWRPLEGRVRAPEAPREVAQPM